MARAIQALAWAPSAIRSATQGALCFSPPAAMYRFAISLSARQFGEVSYFEVLSRTSITHRLTVVSSSLAIESSCVSLEQAVASSDIVIANNGAVLILTSLTTNRGLLGTSDVPRRSLA